MKTTLKRTQAIYSELAIAWVSATITRICQRCKARQGVEKLYSEKNGRFQLRSD